MQYKTPSRIQVEAIECGAVAYWIILGYYNKWISIEQAREDVAVTKDGSSAFNIAEALRSSGFDSDGFSPTIDELQSKDVECGLPCIAWVHKSHWVVVENFKNGKFLISDPARGHRTASPSEFASQYSNLVISARKTNKFKPSGRKPNPIEDIVFLLSSYKWSILLFFILGVSATIPTVALSSFVGYFTDTILEEFNETNSYVWLLILLVGLYFLFSYLQAIILRRLHMSMLTSLIEKTYAKLLSLPLTFYPLRDLGEISQRITLTVNLSNILTGPLATSVVGLISLIIYGCIMLTYDITLGIIVVVLGIINFVGLTAVTSTLSQLAQTSSMLTGRMTSNILYMCNNFLPLKANGEEISAFQQWIDNFSNFQENGQQSSYVQKKNSATTAFLNQLSDYIIVIVSGLFILDGKINLGQFLSFRLIALAFLAPINSLARVNSQFSNAVGDVNRLKDLWMAESDIIAKQLFNDVNTVSLTNNYDVAENASLRALSTIDIVNMHFKYSKTNEPVFSEVNLKIGIGDIISLSGPSGSGKSTLCQCLSAIIKSEYDSFKVNQIDISSIHQSGLRYQICYVSQNRYLFNSTVIDNITVYDDSISSSVVDQAVNKFGFTSLYKTLPQGLNTNLELLDCLSSSDRTSIHLLRALVRSPRMIIIDDIFDSYTEEEALRLFKLIVRTVPICVVVTKSPFIISMCSRSLCLFNRKLIESSPVTLCHQIQDQQSQ